ncbi:MAG: hypothetical protein WC406_00425 [Methanoregula sp.]|nr:hypothetical protein [Methanoregula sp.]MDD5023987.1 hypothetical protein [Methanoregula sp.]
MLQTTPPAAKHDRVIRARDYNCSNARSRRLRAMLAERRVHGMRRSRHLKGEPGTVTSSMPVASVGRTTVRR